MRGGKWDIAVTGTTQMHDILEQDAPKYPKQKSIVDDDVVKQPNVGGLVGGLDIPRPR